MSASRESGNRESLVDLFVELVQQGKQVQRKPLLPCLDLRLSIGRGPELRWHTHKRRRRDRKLWVFQLDKRIRQLKAKGLHPVLKGAFRRRQYHQVVLYRFRQEANQGRLGGPLYRLDALWGWHARADYWPKMNVDVWYGYRLIGRRIDLFVEILHRPTHRTLHLTPKLRRRQNALYKRLHVFFLNPDAT